MNTIECITKRRSVRDWTSKKVESTKLNKILEAGRHTPSPLNSQAWSFIVVKKPETLSKLKSSSNHAHFVDKANVLIVVCIDKNAKVDSWLEKHEQHFYSGACCLQNMWLASWDLGLGACWVTLDEREASKVLAIPTNQKIIGSLALGYAKSRKIDQVPLKNLKDIIHYEKF